MSEFDTNWSREELKAYLLIYCAHADFMQSEAESTFIRSKCDVGVFDKMRAEFESDNDYKSIQKTRSAIQRFNYSKDEINALLSEIQELFLADGNYDTLERSLLMSLNRILG